MLQRLIPGTSTGRPSARGPALALLAATAACGGAPEAAPAPERPNTVLVFVDDMGWGDAAPNAETPWRTPSLDRLAAEGVRFSDFYVSQPVCSASRASLLTGSYANRIGLTGALGPQARHGISVDETTLAELFRSRGYATAAFGKWHLGHHPGFLPTRHGFDEFYGIPYSNDMWPHHPENPEYWGDLPTLEGESVVGYNTDQRRFTTDFTDRGIDFIERSVGAGRPFFLYLPHPMPHVPLHVSVEGEGRSGVGLYGDVIEELDASVGRILDTLQRLAVDDETLVLFVSDNGPWLSYGDHAGRTGPLREGKGTTFEGGVRVPALARWPGVLPAGHVVSEPVMTIDVLPTLARVIGAELPERPIDGRDVWPLLTGEPGARSPHEALFFYYHRNDLEAMRSGRWKLHFPHRYRTMEGRAPGGGGQPGQYDGDAEIGLALFDLEADVGESTDVSDEHPEVVARLTRLADAMREELGDDLGGVTGRGQREPGRLDEATARGGAPAQSALLARVARDLRP